MQTGIIAGINEKGFGFIKIEGQDDLFFHAKELVNVSIEDLKPGDTLEFEIAPSQKDPSRMNAVNVSKV
ncbi:MAG: hypothetical protein AB203_02780 [Parcubacteria bacterium C7867-008]|nr:MAG: hypothetical protein AB203_02780 [Parcubacteria bacterium C7867-008]